MGATHGPLSLPRQQCWKIYRRFLRAIPFAHNIDQGRLVEVGELVIAQGTER